MNRTKRRLVAACVLVVAAGGAVAAAGGAVAGAGSAGSPSEPVRFGVSVSAHRLRYGRPAVVLSVTMRTGGSAETVALGLTESGWPDRQVYGAPLAAGPPRVRGAGRITGGFAAAGASAPGLCFRGASPDDSGITLSLPADTLTTVNYRVRLAAPPWPGIRPTIGAYVSVPAVNPGGAWRDIGRVALTPVGRTGVRISLRGSRAVGASVVVGRGRPLLITGTTRPAIAHASVRIVAARYASQTPAWRPRRVVVGTVSTTSAGTFAVVWRPPARGVYLITASLLRSGATYLADSGCDLTLTAR